MPTSVVLRCCAPVQSWGAVGNSGDKRPTSPVPLHSSITGMMCRALGVDDTDDTMIGRVSDCVMVVRIDNPGHIWNDFQTAAGTVTTEMKPRGTVMSWRGEIQDGCFTVFRQYDDGDLARDIAAALKVPKKTIFFGRRCHAIPVPFHVDVTDNPLNDDLVAAWPTCPWHPPPSTRHSEGDVWNIVEHTIDPLWKEGVTLTGSVAVSFAPRRHRIAAVKQRTIPRTTVDINEPKSRKYALTSNGTVIEVETSE